jgi:tRNA-dihydrouridine synthase
LNIPVIANGDLWHHEDIAFCRRQTGCHGYMSAQGILHNPGLFEPLATQALLQPSTSLTNDHQPQSVATTLPPYMRRRRALAPTTTFRLAFSFTPSSVKQVTASTTAPTSTKAKAAVPSSSSSTGSGTGFSSGLSTPEDVYRQFKLAKVRETSSVNIINELDKYCAIK